MDVTHGDVTHPGRDTLDVTHGDVTHADVTHGDVPHGDVRKGDMTCLRAERASAYLEDRLRRAPDR